jgi:hypothetical protein
MQSDFTIKGGSNHEIQDIGLRQGEKVISTGLGCMRLPVKDDDMRILIFLKRVKMIRYAVIMA